MLKPWKWYGVCIAAGLVVGGGIVGYVRYQRPASPAASAGGVVPLSSAQEPQSTPAGDRLSVSATSDGNVLGTQGAVGSGTGNSTIGGNPAGSKNSTTSSGSGSSDGTTAGGVSLPGPDGFRVYEQYAKEQHAYFIDVVKGSGEAVALEKKVVVNYRGWLTDGTLFDESYSGGKPFGFIEGAHNVIQGWEEGLFGMKVGGTRRLIVPAAAGYGAQAQGKIPANSMLIFDVELLAVQ